MTVSRETLKELRKAKAIFEALAAAEQALEKAFEAEAVEKSRRQLSEALAQKIEASEKTLLDLTQAIDKEGKALNQFRADKAAEQKELEAAASRMRADHEARTKAAEGIVKKAEAEARKAAEELAALEIKVAERKAALDRLLESA